MLVVAGSTAAPTVTFVGLDGEPVDSDVLPVATVASLLDVGDGEPVDVEQVGAVGSGTYRAIVPTSKLDTLRVEFTGAVDGRPQVLGTTVETVGSVLATPLDVRAHPDMRTRPNTPAARLADLLEEFTDLATRYRGHSPIGRRTVSDLAPGLTQLPWPRVQSVDGVTLQDGTVIDGPFNYGDPAWARRTGWVSSTGRVDYTHGQPAVALGMRRAAVGWAAFTVVAEDAGMSRDVLWETTESGTIRYSSPDWAAGRPTGFIVVDAGLNAQPDLRVPGIG